MALYDIIFALFSQSGVSILFTNTNGMKSHFRKTVYKKLLVEGNLRRFVPINTYIFKGMSFRLCWGCTCACVRACALTWACVSSFQSKAPCLSGEFDQRGHHMVRLMINVYLAKARTHTQTYTHAHSGISVDFPTTPQLVLFHQVQEHETVCTLTCFKRTHTQYFIAIFSSTLH